MFSFSRALISVASLYRGGGWVKCWVGVERVQVERLADGEGRQQLVLLLAAGGQTRRWPSNLRTLPWALKSPGPAVMATSVTVKTAGAIWLATNRVDELVEPELVVAEVALDLSRASASGRSAGSPRGPPGRSCRRHSGSAWPAGTSRRTRS